MNVAATVPQLEANPQLSLPTGPFTSFRGGRRDRKDEDRDFLSGCLQGQGGGSVVNGALQVPWVTTLL